MRDDDIWATIPEGVKHLLDALSVGTMLGTLFQMLPNIAAILTIIWTVIRILETDTVRGLVGRKKAKDSPD